MSITEFPSFMRRRQTDEMRAVDDRPRDLDLERDNLQAVAEAVSQTGPTIRGTANKIVSIREDIAEYFALSRALVIELDREEKILAELLTDARKQIDGHIATINETEKLITRIGVEPAA